MSFIAWHPIFKHPLPEGHRFPMIKYDLLHEQLLYEGVANEADFFIPERLSPELLKGVHDEMYAQRLLDLQLTTAEIRRIGFPLSEQLVERELRIAQGTIDAAKMALSKGIGFNVAGGTHHAGSCWGEGFCLLNDQAIAAHYLWKELKLKKILIVDLDVHQGNGTAEIFEENPAIFTFSIHGQNNFPFRKEKSDLDIGLPDNTNGKEYLTILQNELKQVLQTVQPDFVFYQSGVDVLETDRLGKLQLTSDECRERDRIVFNFCKEQGLPVQVSMGGGYSQRISDIVNAHCQTFKEGISIIMG
ncbi:MAG: histone deacetylase [Crocinitomicaceae bacterium]|nr:histone deacetylase [Crocinitomicaceae bacterium]